MKFKLAVITFNAILLLSFGFPSYANESGNAEDLEAINTLILATTDAFNKHDAKAFVQFYTPDAILVTVRGERMIGASQIERGLSEVFKTRAKKGTLKTLDVTITFIKADVAIAHVVNEMSGVVSPQGKELPPHKELSIRVLVKENERWRVTAFHNTIITG